MRSHYKRWKSGAQKLHIRPVSGAELELIKQEAEVRRRFGVEGVKRFWEEVERKAREEEKRRPTDLTGRSWISTSEVHHGHTMEVLSRVGDFWRIQCLHCDTYRQIDDHCLREILGEPAAEKPAGI